MCIRDRTRRRHHLLCNAGNLQRAGNIKPNRAGRFARQKFCSQKLQDVLVRSLRQGGYFGRPRQRSDSYKHSLDASGSAASFQESTMGTLCPAGSERVVRRRHVQRHSAGVTQRRSCNLRRSRYRSPLQWKEECSSSKSIVDAESRRAADRGHGFINQGVPFGFELARWQWRCQTSSKRWH